MKERGMLARIGDVDPDLIAEAGESITTEERKPRRWQKITAITAACLALCIAVGGIVHSRHLFSHEAGAQGLLRVGSFVPSSDQYRTNVSEFSRISALYSWYPGSEEDPTIEIEALTTTRLKLYLSVSFDREIADKIPEEERAMIASLLGWGTISNGFDLSVASRVFQPEFVEKGIKSEMPRRLRDDVTVEQAIEKANAFVDSHYPCDTIAVKCRVLNYYANEEEGGEMWRLVSHSFNADLAAVGLDETKVDGFFVIITPEISYSLANEILKNYRWDPSNREDYADAEPIYIYRYDGVWYLYPKAFGPLLVDHTFDESHQEQISFRGVVKWVQGSYFRLEHKKVEGGILTERDIEKIFYVSDPEILSQIKEGETVEFLCFHDSWQAYLTIEEEDYVWVYPVTELVSSDAGATD